jgi:hypothetical protein
MIFNLSLYGQVNNELKLTVTSFSKERLGIGSEYEVKLNNRSGLNIGIQYLRNSKRKSELLSLTTNEFNLTARLSNYFRIFKKSNLYHYLGIYGDLGLINSSYNGVFSNRDKPQIGFAIGGTIGLLKFKIKDKFSVDLFTKYGYRVTNYENIRIDDSPSGGERFIVIKEYNKGFEINFNIGLGYVF